jgi:hypothetical protein
MLRTMRFWMQAIGFDLLCRGKSAAGEASCRGAPRIPSSQERMSHQLT